MAINITPKKRAQYRVQGFSITPEQYQKLVRVAKHTDNSASAVIRQLIDQLADVPKKRKK